MTQYQTVTHTKRMSSLIDRTSVIMTQRVRVIELPERLWEFDETAQFLRVTARTLYQLNTNGTGPRYFKVGRECRYDPRDVLSWLEARASRPAATGAAA